MDGLVIAGYSCLGAFIGLIVGWFVNQDADLDSKSVGSIIVGVGGTVSSFVPLFSPAIGREFWFYPIALLTGLLIAPVFDVAYNWFYGLKKVKSINDKAYERNKQRLKK